MQVLLYLLCIDCSEFPALRCWQAPGVAVDCVDAVPALFLTANNSSQGRAFLHTNSFPSAETLTAPADDWQACCHEHPSIVQSHHSMNAVAAQLSAQLAREVAAAGGAHAHRDVALRGLVLKTVVKESHGSPIHALAFNQCTTACAHSQGPIDGLHNLFATVGGEQATVYDDAHMGNFLAVVVHFSNSPTLHHGGGALSACAWVNAHGLTRHPQVGSGSGQFVMHRICCRHAFC